MVNEGKTQEPFSVAFMGEPGLCKGGKPRQVDKTEQMEEDGSGSLMAGCVVPASLPIYPLVALF